MIRTWGRIPGWRRTIPINELRFSGGVKVRLKRPRTANCESTVHKRQILRCDVNAFHECPLSEPYVLELCQQENINEKKAINSDNGTVPRHQCWARYRKPGDVIDNGAVVWAASILIKCSHGILTKSVVEQTYSARKKTHPECFLKICVALKGALTLTIYILLNNDFSQQFISKKSTQTHIDDFRLLGCFDGQWHGGANGTAPGSSRMRIAVLYGLQKGGASRAFPLADIVLFTDWSKCALREEVDFKMFQQVMKA